MSEMIYRSTRDNGVSVSSAGAISSGISKDGGLFVPAEFPKLTESDFDRLLECGYVDRAKLVLSKYLTDFTEQELADCVNGAYTGAKWRAETPVPMKKLCDGVHILELWHGPTCAFKDVALQLLPYLLKVSAKKAAPDKEIVILVATSGDTGKAALEGFKDVDGTKIMVFYPADGVSAMQRLQMITQQGGNVAVCAIKGNFDDAQTGVKKIFTDPAVAEKLAENGMMFSSANSINWGRLVPQIVYYVSAYCDLVNEGAIKRGESFNVVVPTGNFGNILAAYYAKQMGVPVAKFICASNSNNVLTDFIRTGTYDKNREFFTTASPSMDILISSNLERLLYDLSGRDDARVAEFMNELGRSGKYTVDADIFSKISELFYGNFSNDDETKETIGRIWKEKGYLCDTHTAVAVSVYGKYAAETGDKTCTVIASTASPYKFAHSVLEAVGEAPENADEFEMVRLLSSVTGTEIPAPLAGLENMQPRFSDCIESADMEDYVLTKTRG